MLKNKHWIIAGATSAYREKILSKADVVIWLDIPLPILLWRLTKRSVYHIVTKKPLWAGNIETWKRFLTNKSVLLQLIKVYPYHKKSSRFIFRKALSSS